MSEASHQDMVTLAAAQKHHADTLSWGKGILSMRKGKIKQGYIQRHMSDIPFD